MGLTFCSYHCKCNIAQGNFLFSLIFAVLFAIIYLLLIGGLFNRYLNRGQFLKSFNIFEIIKLLMIFDFKSFIKVIIAIIIAQASTVLILSGFNDGFSLFELLYSIAAFFLAPFMFFATKRFVGLNVCDLLEKSGVKR
jgi:hypothetical protein